MLVLGLELVIQLQVLLDHHLALRLAQIASVGPLHAVAPNVRDQAIVQAVGVLLFQLRLRIFQRRLALNEELATVFKRLILSQLVRDRLLG